MTKMVDLTARVKDIERRRGVGQTSGVIIAERTPAGSSSTRPCSVRRSAVACAGTFSCRRSRKGALQVSESRDNNADASVLLQAGSVRFETEARPGVYGVRVGFGRQVLVDSTITTVLGGESRGLDPAVFVEANENGAEYAVLQTDHVARRLELGWCVLACEVPGVFGINNDQEMI